MRLLDILFGKKEETKAEKRIRLCKECQRSFEEQFNIIIPNQTEEGWNSYDSFMYGDWESMQFRYDDIHYQIWVDLPSYTAIAVMNVFEKNKEGKYDSATFYDLQGNFSGNRIVGKDIYKFDAGKWILIEKLNRKQIVDYMLYQGFSLGNEPYSLVGQYDGNLEKMIASGSSIWRDRYGLYDDSICEEYKNKPVWLYNDSICEEYKNR